MTAEMTEEHKAEAPSPLRTIPRSEHPISRKNIDREALKVMYRLKDAGFVAYLVGGGVRDLYLGKQPKDFDISTDARPGQIRKLFWNSRTIGRRFRLVQVYFRGGKIVEVSTFRTRNEHDVNGEDTILGPDNTFGSPEDDAFRRDLTINALFYEIDNFSIIDYTGGVEDLDKGIIRVIGDPNRRFNRDPVRILRAIRHAARNNFIVEEQTWQAIRIHGEKLKLCPVSRLRDEIFKDLRGGTSAAWTRLAVDSGIFPHLFPCYEALFTEASGSLQATKDHLVKLQKVVDRLHEAGKPLPDHLLLAGLVLPWALQNKLVSGQPSPQRQGLSKELHIGLDRVFDQLDIKRALREATVTVLGTLPLFAFHVSERRWPKRLKAKSYFADGLFFYRIYEEASGGPLVDTELEPPPVVKSVSRKGGPGQGGRWPAVVKNKPKGGIFGLKND